MKFSLYMLSLFVANNGGLVFIDGKYQTATALSSLINAYGPHYELVHTKSTSLTTMHFTHP